MIEATNIPKELRIRPNMTDDERLFALKVTAQAAWEGRRLKMRPADPDKPDGEVIVTFGRRRIYDN